MKISAFGSFQASKDNQKKAYEVAKALAKRKIPLSTCANPGSDPFRLAYHDWGKEFLDVRLPWAGAFSMNKPTNGPTEKAFEIAREFDKNTENASQMITASCVHMLLGDDCKTLPDCLILLPNPENVGRTGILISMALKYDINTVTIDDSSSVQNVLSTVDIFL